MTNPTTMREAAFGAVNVLTANGHSAFVAGGAVRDLILGREPHDFDVTTSATPAEVAALFPENYDFVGAHFGVSLLKFGTFTVEVATFRTDGSYADNRRPDSVTLVKDVQLDVARRDFTVGALLMDANGDVFDYVGGMKDLENRVLRCVGNPFDRFEEDALRMLRAVRFCAQLGFTMHPETFAAVCANASRVQSVSAERVASELGKMFTSGHADVAFYLLQSIGLAQYVMPELVPMVGCEHDNPVHHPEGDVAAHTGLLLAGLPKDCSLTLALAALLHDVGKPVCRTVTADGHVVFRGHAEVGAKMTEEILRRLKFSNDVVTTVVSHVANHMRFFQVSKMKRSTLVRFARTPNFTELVEVARLDASASSGNMSDVEFVEKFLEEHEEELHCARLVTGNDLVAMGLTPGPAFKTLLDAVETEQLEGRVTTREAALDFVRCMVGV